METGTYISPEGELFFVRPPLGIRPRWYVMEERMQEIEMGMDRFQKANRRIPDEWINEREDIISWLKEHFPDSPMLKDI